MLRPLLVVLPMGLAALLLAAPLRADSLDFIACCTGEPADAFQFGEGDEPAPFRTVGNGWTVTSSGSSGLGNPATITWSIVPDGTAMPQGLGEPNTPSNLISFLDGIHHGGPGPGGTDLTQRDWFSLYNSSFERWDAVSGITFNYESNDDGVKLGTTAGQLGVRGDHRVGGHSIDGQISPTFLAYNYFPNNSDMVIDTDELNRWGNDDGNFALFRFMLMHEAGHGLGLTHVESNDVDPGTSGHQFGSFLMEPFISSAFDGPQFDDILGVHRLYGDQYEEQGGNDTSANATSLGTLLAGQTKTIGADAVDIAVAPTDIDFVSIDDDSDTDYFKFSLATPIQISVTLTPHGPTYQEGAQGSANAGTQQPYVTSEFSDLNLTLIDSDGSSILEFSNDTGKGGLETIDQYFLPAAGDYYLKIRGVQNAAQFYQLDLTAVPEPSTMLLIFAALASCSLRLRPAREFGSQK